MTISPIKPQSHNENKAEKGQDNEYYPRRVQKEIWINHRHTENYLQICWTIWNRFKNKYLESLAKKRRLPITTKIAKEKRRFRKAADSHQKYSEDHSKISEVFATVTKVLEILQGARKAKAETSDYRE